MKHTDDAISLVILVLLGVCMGFLFSGDPSLFEVLRQHLISRLST